MNCCVRMFQQYGMQFKVEEPSKTSDRKIQIRRITIRMNTFNCAKGLLKLHEFE